MVGAPPRRDAGPDRRGQEGRRHGLGGPDLAQNVFICHIPCMATHQLRADERELFTAVAKAVRQNPFAEDAARAEALDPLLAQLDRALVAVDRRRAVAQDSEQARHLERARLFAAYYRASAALDAHIAAQEAEGDQPVRFAAGAEILAELSGAGPRGGLPDAAAHGALSLFFQLRRAYHFLAGALAGQCRSMVQLRADLWNAVFTRDLELYEAHLVGRMEEFSTLIVGETGTGKGAAAAAIGRSGHIPYTAAKSRFVSSFTAMFVPLNLASVPEPLIESALFGHQKGAFTGAVADRPGLFSRCPPGGSIFLDEIGELAEPVQVKLLDVLQDRSFAPVGAAGRTSFRGRLIAATHRDPRGRLRDDLYWRLASDVVVVPPLRQRIRERPAELTELALSLLQRWLGNGAASVCERVLEALVRDVPADHPWPGNVRELEQCLRRVLLHGHCRVASAGPADAPIEALVRDEPSARELLGRYSRHLLERYGDPKQVAQRLGVDRRTAQRYLEGFPASGPNG